SASAAAVPTRYIVFERGADGRVDPVFYTEVDLAMSALPDATGAVDRDHDTRVVYRAFRAGVDLGDRSVDVPMLHGEFAHDPERGDNAIDSTRPIDGDRSFVLRIPVDEADAIEFPRADGSQRFDLSALKTDAHALSLADRVPSLQVTQEASAGSPANRLDLLVIGDGYTSAQHALFDSDAMILHDSFFGLTPYHEYMSFVNWTTGFVASNQSGADHPPYQSGCTSSACCADSSASGDPLSGQMVDTAFNGRFCTSQIQRLVTVSSSAVLAAAAAYPGWDKIFVVVNDATYGGSGGSISVTSTNQQANQIILHEFGHSFSHLADEYASPYPGFPACSDLSGSAPCEANVTNQTAAASVKWSPWFTPGNAIPTPIGTAGVGLFEGARYLATGMYRPVDTQCLMQFLGKPFCPVCRQEYVRTLYRGGFGVPATGIDLIEPGSESPATTPPVNYAAGSTRVFQVTLLRPTVGTLAIQWLLDGAPVSGATGSSYAFTQAATTPATHTLQLRVTDSTSFVTPSMAGSLLDHTRTWTIHVSAGDLIFANSFD
ncbi:MAG: M64 family metallopeptidase, partial [Dokdonella sp.]|uniref:M64 family metallopeptidase n=1 Tax=Dokdonella sp. TaxID=2291710 RepID=UPI0032664429